MILCIFYLFIDIGYNFVCYLKRYSISQNYWKEKSYCRKFIHISFGITIPRCPVLNIRHVTVSVYQAMLNYHRTKTLANFVQGFDTFLTLAVIILSIASSSTCLNDITLNDIFVWAAILCTIPWRSFFKNK